MHAEMVCIYILNVYPYIFPFLSPIYYYRYIYIYINLLSLTLRKHGSPHLWVFNQFLLPSVGMTLGSSGGRESPWLWGALGWNQIGPWES